MKQVVIDPPLEPMVARAALRHLFPEGGEYLVQDPAGRWSNVVLQRSPADDEGVGELIKAVFPSGGRYLVARAPKEGAAFDEWFLERLVEEARRHYTSTRQLVRRVVERFIGQHDGDLTDPDVYARFEELLFDVRRASGFSIGMNVSPATRVRLAELGVTSQEVYDWPAIAYRLGRVYRSVGPTATFSWTRAMALAESVKLTDTERAAMAFARQRAGIHLTPVLLREPQRAWETVAAEEQRLLRVMTRRAIRDRGGAMKLARDLYEKLDKEGGIARDWERVARTEISDARSEGSWAVEMSGVAEDGKIYRDTSSRACSECLRLYREPDGSPRLYTKAEILAEDALGPNTVKPYHARIASTHPQCVCGPFQAAPSDFVAGLHRKKFGPVMEERGLA